MMSLVRLLSFTTLACGCVTGEAPGRSPPIAKWFTSRKRAARASTTGIAATIPSPPRSSAPSAPQQIAQSELAALQPDKNCRLRASSWHKPTANCQPTEGRYCKLLRCPSRGSRRALRSPTPRFKPDAAPCGSTSGTASEVLRSLDAGHDFRDRDVASLQPRGALPELRRHASPRPISGLDGSVDQGGGEGPGPRGIALPERRSRSPRTRGRPLDVAQAARRTSSSRTRFTGSSRLRSTGTRPAPAPDSRAT